jgi:hypothetical protein
VTNLKTKPSKALNDEMKALTNMNVNDFKKELLEDEISDVCEVLFF